MLLINIRCFHRNVAFSVNIGGGRVKYVRQTEDTVFVVYARCIN